MITPSLSPSTITTILQLWLLTYPDEIGKLIDHNCKIDWIMGDQRVTYGFVSRSAETSSYTPS